jgi:hypothetical protein
MAQDRDQWWERGGTCEHCNESSGSIEGGNFLSSWTTTSFSTWTLLQVESYKLVFRTLNLYRLRRSIKIICPWA